MTKLYIFEMMNDEKYSRAFFFPHQMSFRHFGLGRIISLLYLTHNILNPNSLESVLLSGLTFTNFKLPFFQTTLCFGCGKGRSFSLRTSQTLQPAQNVKVEEIILKWQWFFFFSQPDLWKLKLIICCVWACFVLGERANQAPRACCPLITHISLIHVCGQWPDHSNSIKSQKRCAPVCGSYWCHVQSCMLLHF